MHFKRTLYSYRSVFTKEILTLKHFLFLLLLLGQRVLFNVQRKLSLHNRQKQNSRAALGGGRRVPHSAPGGNAWFLPSRGLSFAQLQGALVTQRNERALLPLPTELLPHPLLVATEAPPGAPWNINENQLIGPSHCDSPWPMVPFSLPGTLNS